MPNLPGAQFGDIDIADVRARLGRYQRSPWVAVAAELPPAPVLGHPGHCVTVDDHNW